LYHQNSHFYFSYHFIMKTTFSTLTTLKLFVSAVALTVATSSCANLLNVEPVTSIDGNTDLKTALSVNIALNGAYDGLSNRYIWGGESWCYADLLGDENELRFRGTFGYLGDIWLKRMIPNSSAATEMWLSGFTGINRVNRVLATIDTLPAAERNNVRGQALFIRAAINFELVRFYGKTWGDGTNASNPALPIILQPTTAFLSGNITAEDNRTRNSVADVYARVISDLTDAETLLDANSNNTRANKATAAALLSRVYLMQGNYAAARDAANRVLATGRYRLTPTFAEAFDDSSPNYNSMPMQPLVAAATWKCWQSTSRTTKRPMLVVRSSTLLVAASRANSAFNLVTSASSAPQKCCSPALSATLVSAQPLVQLLLPT
jgi:starch-binding outer membrane protein, SusD/RagB family